MEREEERKGKGTEKGEGEERRGEERRGEEREKHREEREEGRIEGKISTFIPDWKLNFAFVPR